MGLVSVAMPVREPGPGLTRALRSILDQTHRDLDVMAIVRAGDGATADAVRAAAGGDDRVRILERPQPGLAAALNFAMDEARSDLVARMDADDWSAPGRIAVQVARMARDPELAAVGCAFRVEDAATGEEIETIRPPTEAHQVAWRLMVGNTLAHGSMVVRRDAVIEAGGYDEGVERGQDYELWVRMVVRGLRIGCVPDVAYAHAMPRDRRGVSAGDEAQAATVARVMMRAWGSLRPTGRGPELEEALAACARGTPGAATRSAEAVLDAEGPTREGMMAWLWCCQRGAMAQWPAIEAGRAALVRELGARMRATGVDRVWVWGAGTHTAWLLERREDLGVEILGVVDDARPGVECSGFVVAPSDAMEPGEHALLSSDTMEARLWDMSARARERGVRVWRMYA